MRHKIVVGLVVLMAACSSPDDTTVKVDTVETGLGLYTGFLEGQAVFADRVSILMTDLATAATNGDIRLAGALSIDLWTMFLNADRAPTGFPLAVAHNNMMDTCEHAFDVVSDGFIAVDPDLLDEGTALVYDCNTAIGTYTANIVGADK